MRKANRRALTVAKIRTIAFLLAMMPVLIVVALVGILSLIVLSPVVMYAGSIRGKPLKHRQCNAGAGPR
jgi:flagellar biosynthesis protein FlhB